MGSSISMTAQVDSLTGEVVKFDQHQRGLLVECPLNESLQTNSNYQLTKD